jgi:DNA polymerase-4
MQKPDGLTLILREELPDRLYGLKLADFPGIGPRMDARLRRQGVTTVRQMCQLTPQELSRLWGSRVLGRAWWHRLRGDDLSESPTRRRSVGHSHVLPPAFRTDAAARTVLMRLVHKAAARLRNLGHWAGSVALGVGYLDAPGWHAGKRLPPCRDTFTLIRAVSPLWEQKPPGTPLRVGVTLGDLTSDANTALPLFEEDRKLLKLARAMDELNQQFGPRAVYFAEMTGAQATAPMRIAFTRIPDPHNRDG